MTASIRIGLGFLLCGPMLSLVSGCGDETRKRVNSPRPFEATYLKRETSQLGSGKTERIELQTNGNKFLTASYVYDKLVRKTVYDGERLWEFIPKRHLSGQDTVIYQEASFSEIKDRVYFWRMPPIRGLHPPEEKTIDGRSYQVYEYSDPGPSGRVEVSIVVDRDQHFIKSINSKFFMKTFGEEPFMEWDLDCRRIDFRNDIPDATFSFTPPPGAAVKTAREAAREGLEAFKGLLQGP